MPRRDLILAAGGAHRHLIASEALKSRLAMRHMTSIAALPEALDAIMSIAERNGD
jgi:hypothetical protein